VGVQHAINMSPGVDVVTTGACTTVARSFTGSEADDVAILCRPRDGSADAGRQATAAYRALGEVLAAKQASFRDLVRETLFLRDVRGDLPSVLNARANTLADLGGDTCPPPAFIGQPPADPCARFVLAASVLLPHRPRAVSVHDIRAKSSCACRGCARSAARVVRLGDRTSLYTTNVYGTPGDPLEEAGNMFRAAQRLIERCGMAFGDVVRTWIHLRDVERDYDVLNKVRREFFRRCGIERRPASTGVQGLPFCDAHHFSLSLQAIRSRRPLDVSEMSTSLLNEAWSYGAEFSRGVRVADTNRVTLYVSGTASIDERGRTVHEGSFGAQAERMLENIASLLARQDATFADVVSAVAYVKDPSDAPALQSLFRRRGFDGFPCPLVNARLCRPELLCEAEAVVMLPRTAGG